VKKIGAEIILTVMVLPWAIWITIGIFASQKADAIQETKFQIIIEKLDDLKELIKNGK